MAETSIEWCDSVWNPVTGCTPVSPGCEHCYARRMATRLAGRYGYPVDEPFRVTLHPDKIKEPLRWHKPRRVFVNSMSDLFHNDVPDSFIDDVFAVMAMARQHTFLVLTKRPERMKRWFAETPSGAQREFSVYESACALDLRGTWPGWPLPNVWLGVTAEDQRRADERIPLLLQTPAAVRFVSCEPLLGPVDLEQPVAGSAPVEGVYPPWMIQQVDWVIVGGETGPGARPMHPDWARSLRDQCRHAGVPFLFKQWGEWRQAAPPDDPIWSGYPPKLRYKDGAYFIRLGKHSAGRLLDGVLHDEYPVLSK